MSNDDADAAARAMAELAAVAAKDPHLAAEMQRARREFFAAGPVAAVSLPGAAEAAEQRFREWFLLERESEVLGAVPLTVKGFDDDADRLEDSTAGLWLVQASAGTGVEARDLQDGEVLDLEVPPESLAAGDLVVGRLFPHGAGRWTPSRAAAIFRPGADIAQAFLRDMQRLGLERRLQQIELEHLLLRRPQTKPVPPHVDTPSVPLEHLEADLDALLARTGSEHSATTISQQLAIAVRPGPVMGPLLDELAFDTDVDLDRARALLLAIWNAQHLGEDGAAADAAPVDEVPGESLGERLVRTLDEGLAQKRDVAELFAQLERMAGVEPDPEDDEVADDEDGADDEVVERARPPADEAEAAAGNLAALVEEYLWETDRREDPAAEPLRLFAELQQNAALPPRDLEEITATDVMRLLLHAYLGAAPSERAATVRATFAQLGGFYQWASEVQELDVGQVLAGCQGALLDQLDRLQAAGEGLSTPANGRARPGVLEVEEVGPRGFGVRDDDGGNHWLEVAPATAANLRVGDLVLGALGPATAGQARGFVGLVVVLPADARSLME